MKDAQKFPEIYKSFLNHVTCNQREAAKSRKLSTEELKALVHQKIKEFNNEQSGSEQ